ncbi:hypothetical protein DPMN_091967 [Dreissena polymorpha]|uniref:Uncharacterized protein n=1 Tax=Dreissena polymorpha TaxID=45954 RepID=A0A9D4L1G9_DREPO|nr:hypothetical protein DPMN_091967 [Dreissena polymorpha]
MARTIVAGPDEFGPSGFDCGIHEVALIPDKGLFGDRDFQQPWHSGHQEQTGPGHDQKNIYRTRSDGFNDNNTANRKINVASRVKNVPPPGSHFLEDRTVNVASGVKKSNIIIFELIQDNIETNLLTKCHEDWTINVASRELTPHVRKNAPPLGNHFHEDRTINLAPRGKNAPPLHSHVFQANITMLELIHDINKTNLLTKFHEDWTINVASRVLRRKNAPHPWRPCFSTKGHHTIGMNLLTKFHEDWTINVASRVKNAPPLGSNAFQAKVTILWPLEKNAPPPGGHVFQPTGIIFELVQDIIGMNLLTKKNGSPLGSHVFQANVTIFKLIQDIIETNLLTKFYEDWTINVAFRELTSQMLTAHDGRRTKSDHKGLP